MKLRNILLALLFVIPLVSSQQFRIEDNNRVAAIPMNKDTIVTFLFYGDSYSVELGGFDFEHNRVTMEMHPQLGTDIVNLNAATNWDLDLDGEDDLALTLISLDPNEGSNVNGEKGTAVIRLESLTPIPEEPTTVTTSKAESTATTSVAGAAVVGKDSLSSLGGSTTWIIAGIVVGVLVILFLMKDKIRGVFNKGESSAGSGQSSQTPANYRPAKSSGGAGKCQKCGRDLQPGIKFCNNCGAKVTQKKTFCPQCGTEFKGGKFCQNCGHKMM